MQAESIASCANNSRVQPVTRSRGVSCRSCRAASACSSYLRAASTAVIQHAHAWAKRSEAYAGTHQSTLKMWLRSCAERRDKRICLCADTEKTASVMAFSHRLHDWQLSSMAGARWLNAPTPVPHARVFAISANSVHSVASSAAMLQRDACSKNACATREPHRRTPPHALNITHLPALIQAPDHHALSDIGLETQTMKPAIRGACGTCLQTM